MWSQFTSAIKNILIVGFALLVIMTHLGAMFLTVGVLFGDTTPTIMTTLIVLDGFIVSFWIGYWIWSAYKEVSK